jgi:hypothetical protein
MSEDSIEKRLYRIFDPAPLRPDHDNLYIELDNVRGDADIVNRLASRIRFSDKPTCQILAGHRGSGKSTELYRLQHHLQTTDQEGHRYFVVFCECDDDIDRNDVDFPEVLLAIVRQTAKQLRDREGIHLDPGYFKDCLQRIKSLLTSEIQLEGFELDTGLLKLSGAIKGSPDGRKKIREKLEPDTSNLITAANDVLSQAMLELTKKAWHGMVIVVDDLDKMIVRPHSSGCTTAEYLFIHREAQLSAFNCHVVYTAPLGLAYSVQERNVANLYGGPVPVVPMVKIHTQNGQSHEPGMKKMREMIDVRLKAANARPAELFQNDFVQDELICWSGGQPRELMLLIRDAIIRGRLCPITSQSLNTAVRDSKRAYARQLRQEHWPIIQQVAKTGQLQRSDSNENLVRDLLDSRALLQYVNDKEWYAVNPFLVEALEAVCPCPPSPNTP